jgi:E3 ubiquitin-protein ligase FANCL
MDAFPLIRTFANGKKFEGFLHNFVVQLEFADDPSGRRFSIDPRGALVLANSKSIVLRRLHSATSAVQFFTELASLLRSALATSPVNGLDVEDVLKINISDIVSEIEEIGWEKISAMAPDFSSIDIQGCVTVALPSFEASFRLPSAVPNWTPVRRQHRLKQIMDKYIELSAQFAPYEEELRMLRERCPVHGSDGRIALSDSVSVLLDIDPRRPRTLPAIRFLGSDANIRPFRMLLTSRVGQVWSLEMPIWKNLERVFNIDCSALKAKFTTMDELQNDSDENECAICYGGPTTQGLGPLDTRCENRQCAKRFHHQCLLEYVQSAPGARQSFDVYYGECPYCTQSIHVKSSR